MFNRLTSWAQAHPISTFYGLAFAIAWLGWVPSLAASAGIAYFAHPVWSVLLLLPAVSPALAAGLTLGWRGDSVTPLPTLFRWQVSPRWYIVAVGLPLVTVWLANSASQWLSTGVVLPPVRGKDLILFTTLSVLANPWEEVGWRGFALSRLQSRFPVFTASLLVGSLWGVWHLPLFFIHTGTMAMTSIPFLPWFIGTVGWSFVLAWLFNHTGGNVLICSLCHIASNAFSAALGTNSFWALAFVKVGLALVLWLTNKPPVVTVGLVEKKKGN